MYTYLHPVHIGAYRPEDKEERSVGYYFRRARVFWLEGANFTFFAYIYGAFAASISRAV